MPRTVYVVVEYKQIISNPVALHLGTLPDAPTTMLRKVTGSMATNRKPEVESIDLKTEPEVEPFQGSAARLGTGNIEGTDVQWPPGRVETAGSPFTQPAPVGGIAAPTEPEQSATVEVPERVLAANPPNDGTDDPARQAPLTAPLTAHGETTADHDE
jgi:hypothetical protein